MDERKKTEMNRGINVGQMLKDRKNQQEKSTKEKKEIKKNK